MQARTKESAIRRYSERFFIHPLSRVPIIPPAEAVVVIPSYGEPGLPATLGSLRDCLPSGIAVSVLVVVNEPAGAPPAYSRINAESLSFMAGAGGQSLPFPLVVLDARGLPARTAGVGLARKIGMDAVLLQSWVQDKTALICLDADCRVAPVYLQALEQFARHPADVAVLEFDHNPAVSEPGLQAGIEAYEAFLEYYRLGLCYAGYPYFHHTVGSSMGVKAGAYARGGGMNQRKAGEDFYFLHKLFPHFRTLDLSGPLVFPSGRISDRVPFGTGRFQEQWSSGQKTGAFTYHPQVFSLLRLFLFGADRVLQDGMAGSEDAFAGFRAAHPDAGLFLDTSRAGEILERSIRSSPLADRRKRHFFTAFDGLAVLRLIHFFAARFPPSGPGEGIRELMRLWHPVPVSDSLPELTRQVRGVLAKKLPASASPH